jgi:hypothetical protein
LPRGAPEVTVFLSSLATDAKVTASTQNPHARPLRKIR